MEEGEGAMVPQYILEITREGSKVGGCDGSEMLGSDMMIIAHSLGPGIDREDPAYSVDGSEDALPPVERVIFSPSSCVER